MAHYLVVAHQTADSEELVKAVRKLAEHGDSTFALLVPATRVNHLATWTEGEAQAAAAAQADRAEGRLRAVGVEVVSTTIGDASPLLAVQDALLAGRYDAIVVSTFPIRTSRWLRMNLIQRLERAVDVPIVHVVAHSRG
jgi:hypothetical protein